MRVATYTGKVDIRHLRYFIAIVESGSLSQAARRLHIVQPALSQRVADLEKELGTQLLIRAAQGVAVTTAGQELYNRALTIVKQLEAAQTAVRELDRGVCGTVHIGVLRTAARSIAPALFDALRVEYPAVVAQVRVGYSADLAALLKAGKLDIAMQVRSGHGAGQRGSVLYSERLCLVGPPELVPDVASMTVDQLRGVPLLLSSIQPSYSTILGVAEAHGVVLSVVGGIEDDGAVLHICESGAAATILPEASAATEIRGRMLRMAVIEDPQLRRDILLSTNPDVPSTGVVLAVENILHRLLKAVHSVD